MNILLAAVNAKYIHSNLAVYSLKASAGRYEPLICLEEYTINHQTDDIFRAICEKKPDLLFFYCYIWNRRVILETAENIHRVLPDTVIWAGGPEVSYDAEIFLRENLCFTGVMVGEGEQTFRQLLAYYVDGIGSPGEIPGIVYRESGVCDASDTSDTLDTSDTEARLISTGPAPLLPSLDALPFVYGKLEDFKNRIIYYETSRGCPFSCSYCLSSIDKSVRFRSMELVRRELAFFLEHRVPQVKFVDRTFNCNHAHAQEIWRFIRDHDNGVTNFHFEIEADLLNEEELALLGSMRPGLAQLEIGVQTVNGEALAAIRRTAKFDRIAARVERISSYGNIHQHLDLIAGLPCEDFRSFQQSFDAVYRLHPQELQLGFLKVLKGSEMHRRAQEYGIVYRSAPPYEVLATRWMGYEELLRLKEIEEVLEIYYNSQQFRCTLTWLETKFARPFALFAALADYYKEEKLTGRAWSRMQRFEHLRAFAQAVLSGKVFGASKAQSEPDVQAEDAKPAGTCEREEDVNPAGLCEREENVKQAGLCEWEKAVKPAGPCEQRKAGAEYALLDELLTLDFYLRENAKTRPEWAEDLSPWRERIIQFYQKEAKTYEHLPLYRGMNSKQVMRMTHLERVTCADTGAFWKAQPEDGKAARKEWMLFDYARRDPLTGDAAVTWVEL